MYDIGFIGLGKMGARLANLATQAGYNVAGFDKYVESPNQSFEVKATLNELVKELKLPRIMWMMVPAGEPVEECLNELTDLLEDDDLIIEAGNSHFEDSIRHARELAAYNIHFLDCGTSGGLLGAETGACLMVGGDQGSFERVRPILEALSVPKGLVHCGASGSGHFVKMVHNGIEYGMMQSIGEGVTLLEESPFDLDLRDVADVWNHGSVIRGWLMELLASALDKDPSLENFKGPVGHSGEGTWTVQTADKLGVSVPSIKSALDHRIASKDSPDSMTSRVLSALRFGFGGHANG